MSNLGESAAASPEVPTTPLSAPSSSLPVLLCGGCQHAIAREVDILHERDPKAWRDHVYSYEIDLFESGRSVWAYSATNPSARRFDLLRVAAVPSALASSGTDVVDAAVAWSPLIHLSGPYSPEHSFFVGFEWCFAACATCGHFLGWGFASSERCAAARATAQSDPAGSGHSSSSPDSHEADEDADEDEEEAPVSLTPDFFGVIVTQCTGECEYPLARYEEDLAQAHHRCEVRRAMGAYRRQLVRQLNTLPSTGMAQRLFLYYQYLERTLFRTGSVDQAPAPTVDVRLAGARTGGLGQRRQRGPDDDEGVRVHAQPQSSPERATGDREGDASLIPRVFRDLSDIVANMLQGTASEEEQEDQEEEEEESQEDAQ